MLYCAVKDSAWYVLVLRNQNVV